MPYLTPDEIPEDDVCRPLSIPASTDWLAFFGGALTELTKKYNWQQWGAVSVDDTVAKMQEIIDNWYGIPCASCELPEGGSIIRIGADGRIEELVGGEWINPVDGDYYIPPPAAREGGTETDQICLAAANAVNALHTLYESLSDSWNGDLDNAEAATAFVGVLVGIVGFAAAPIAFGITAFFLPIFAALYTGLEYLFADLWDEDVSQQIECFLVQCAINTDGVVTFDWDCFTGKLNSLANGFSLTAEQVRLYIQISYLLYCIGGIDMLNLAGRTEAITEADCDPCLAWCYRWFGAGFDQGDWVMETYPDTTPTTYDSVNGAVGGFQNTGVSYAHIADITYGAVSGNVTFIGVGIDFSRAGGAADNYAVLYINGVDVAHSPNLSGAGLSSISWTGSRDDITSIEVVGGVESNPGEAGHFWIPNLTMRGDGANPIDVDNCT